MKRAFCVLLTVLMVFGMCLSFSGCVAERDMVGIWENVTWTSGEFEQYLYVFEDGTCSGYGYWMDKWQYLSKSEWEIEGEYFVRRQTGWDSSVSKFKIDGRKMYDSQGNLVYVWVGSDVSIDIKK